MKTTIIKVLALIAITTFTFFSCVEDGDFNTPDVTIQEPDLTDYTETTFRSVVAAYQQAQGDGDDHVTFDQNLYITGYVISSDRAGNFYKELIIQNKEDGSTSAEDPRLGFRVSVDVTSLHNTYDVGRKVYVMLNGLSFGESNGVYVIGKGSDLDEIGRTEFDNFIVRSSEVSEITPKVTTIDELTEADENTLIQLSDVQFRRDQLGLTYSGEPGDDFDGFRTLETCGGSTTIPLQTASGFSDFTYASVNPNRGSIQGIYSRDFGDDFSVLIINTPADISFDDIERCDPIELDCGIAASEGSNILFSDNFETQTTFQPVSGNGWTNYIQEGTQNWQAYTSTGSNPSLGVSARIGSFRSDDASTIAWLITPLINLDNQDGETLTFQTSNSFADGSNLELLFSSDWDGNPDNITSATWGVLPAAYITQDSDAFGSWFESGIVDLSCASGSIYIAFRYTGSGDDNSDGTYELDEINIRSN